MGNNIDTALAALEVKGSGSEDEGNTESSCFKDSLLLGKEKLEIYWLKMTEDTLLLRGSHSSSQHEAWLV